MRKIVLLTAAFGLLAGMPVLAHADVAATSQPAVVASTPSGGLLQRWFSHARAPKTVAKYGDPFDSNPKAPGQIIVVPVGG